MAYYAAVLDMLDPSRNDALRPQHLAFLEACEKAGQVFARGPFADGSGGMVIYIADSYEDAERLASRDPYVTENVRKLQLREWNMTLNAKL